ncbi:MAG TPA: hypothetical protein VK988_17150 [Acidimicrobiales bacterium]|nr:hypothetical protein [Acidimicrobiales bacterium]
MEWTIVGALMVRQERKRHRRRDVIDARSRLVLPPDEAGRGPAHSHALCHDHRHA